MAKKKLEVAYWLRVAGMMGDGLAPEQACEKIYQDLLAKGDVKGAGRVVGIELNPARVQETREAAKKRGLEARANFLHADVMEVSLSDATVVLFYLFSTASAALKPKLEAELQPGTRVVMESFPVHGWKPIGIKKLEHRTFYLYRMPPEIDRDD